MGQSAQPFDVSSLATDTGVLGSDVDEDELNTPFSRLFTDMHRFLARCQTSREASMGECSKQVDQYMNALVRDMTALNEAIRHNLDSEVKVERQLADSADCMTSLLEIETMKHEAVEADLPEIEDQESQQLLVAKASADALNEAIQQLKAAEANGADLCGKVVQQAQNLEALLRYIRVPRAQEQSQTAAEASMAVSTGKEQTQTSAEANMALPTGQGAQQLQTLIKDVAALDQALCQLQALQGRVKRLLATSQSDLTTILEQGTRNHIALLGEQESQQLRVAADNVGALELAFYQLKAAQINGATLADKVIQQVALTQTAMAVTTTDGSQKITIPEGNVAILKKAVRGLLAVQTNSAALDEAVKQFTASAQSFLAAGREQNGGQIRGNTAQTAPQTNI